jgi:hypothetical protein
VNSLQIFVIVMMLTESELLNELSEETLDAVGNK